MGRPLNRREQKKLIRKTTEEKNKIITMLFVAGFFLSVVLSVYSYVQFHWTIIDYKIPLSIFISSGLLLGVFIKKYLKNIIKYNTAKVHLLWFMFYTGSLITALFFLLNNVFSKQEVYSIRTLIVDRYKSRSKSGRESVHAKVKLVSFTKDLAFPIEDEEKVYASNVVLLQASRGGLGFEIIKDRTLIKN